jgi:hypothetical protein
MLFAACLGLLTLPTQASASRFKDDGVYSPGPVFATQNRWTAANKYSKGGTAKTVFTFTAAPLWPLIGLVKVKGELRLLSRLSLAFQLAGGFSVPHERAAIGMGGQVSVYFAGNFDRGWCLGGNYFQLGDMLDPTAALQTPFDRFQGAFIGWKSTASNRTVLEFQLGAQQWIRSANSPNGAAPPSILPTLGMHYGWSF